MGLKVSQSDELLKQWLSGAQQAEQQSQKGMEHFGVQGRQEGAKLEQLSEEARLKQEAIERNAERVRREMIRNRIDPSKSSMTFNESGGGYNPENDPMGRSLGNAIRRANITGFKVTDPDNVIPTPKDAEEVKQAAAAVKQGQQYIPTVKEAVGKSSWADRFGSSNIGPIRIGTEGGRDLEQRKTALLDYARSLSNTGVLQPGEIPMLEKRIGDITGVGSMFRSPEEINKQISEFETQLKTRADSHARARGYTPDQGYLDTPKSSGLDPAKAARLKELRAKKAAGQL